MKKPNRFDLDSHSTHQKQRRFQRRSNSKSPHSHSLSGSNYDSNSNYNSKCCCLAHANFNGSCSPRRGNAKNRDNDSSIGKFWIKDVDVRGIVNTGIDIGNIITTKIGTRSPSKPTPQLPHSLHCQSLPKPSPNQSIQSLSRQLSNYHSYLQSLQSKHKALQAAHTATLSTLSSTTAQLKELQSRYGLLVKEIDNGNGVNGTTGDNRGLRGYYRDVGQLEEKVRQLEDVVYRNGNAKDGSGIGGLKTINSLPVLSGSSNQEIEYIRNREMSLQKQLYETRQQVKRLKIAQDCMQIKYFKQLESLRQKKQKQYEQLKKKFTQLLQKYKKVMLKLAQTKIKNFKQLKNQSSHSQPVPYTFPSQSQSLYVNGTGSQEGSASNTKNLTTKMFSSITSKFANRGQSFDSLDSLELQLSSDQDCLDISMHILEEDKQTNKDSEVYTRNQMKKDKYLTKVVKDNYQNGIIIGNNQVNSGRNSKISSVYCST